MQKTLTPRIYFYSFNPVIGASGQSRNIVGFNYKTIPVLKFYHQYRTKGDWLKKNLPTINPIP
jgi:hypothetical protein